MPLLLQRTNLKIIHGSFPEEGLARYRRGPADEK
jgi:hypothetical protein